MAPKNQIWAFVLLAGFALGGEALAINGGEATKKGEQRLLKVRGTCVQEETKACLDAIDAFGKEFQGECKRRYKNEGERFTCNLEKCEAHAKSACNP